MAITCFDELLATKGIVLVRGDLISHLHEDEGKVLLDSLLQRYLIEDKHETVKKFNSQPD